MQKVGLIILACLLVMGLALPVQADDHEMMTTRLGEGFMEAIKSPLALFTHPKESMDENDNTLVGFGKGIIGAPFVFLEELGDGLVDFVTFPIVDSQVETLAATPSEKFGMGMQNIVKSPVRMIEHIREVTEGHDMKVLSFLRGVLQSPFALIDSLGHGLVDALTFFVESKNE